MRTKYIFPAVFEAEETGGFSIYFPDIPGCYSDADSIEEGIKNAEDALCLMLYHFEEEKREIPTPSSIPEVTKSIREQDFVTYIKCDTLEYRRYFNAKAVKKTLTIPAWLNDIAEREDVNFSHILQKALKQALEIETQ